MFAPIDSIPIPVHIFEREENGSLVLVESNSASSVLLGGRIESSVGKSVTELLPGRWGERALKFLEKAWQQTEPLNLVHRLPTQSKQHVFSTTLTSQIDLHGQVVRLIVTNQDASLFSEMRTRVVRAEARNNEMGRLVSLAAHDLRAPMRNIKVIGELLRDDFKDLGDGKLELVEMLEQISDKSLVMVTSILNTVSTANRQKEQITTSLPLMCEDLRQILDPVGIHSILCNKVNLYVDDRLLRTVVRNLIDNAIKHGDQTSLMITVQVTAAPMPYMLQIEISDTGKGFDNPNDVLDVGNIDTHIGGFGLSTLDNMLRRHGGSISFANAPEQDRGAVVTVVMPGGVYTEGVDR